MRVPCSPARSSGPVRRSLSWTLLALAGLTGGCGGYYYEDCEVEVGSPSTSPSSPTSQHDATPVAGGKPTPRPGDVPSTSDPTPLPDLDTEPGPLRGGFVVVTGDDTDDLWHCEGQMCGGLYPTLFRAALTRSRSGGEGILAIGVNGAQALRAFDSWNAPAQGGPGARVTHVRSEADIAAVNFARYAFVYLPSADLHTPGGLSGKQISALNARQPDLVRFVNERGGSLLALTQAQVPGGWGFLPVPLQTADIVFDVAEPTEALRGFVPSISTLDLSHRSFHNVFTGPAGYSGLHVLAYNDEVYNPHTGRPVMLGGTAVVLSAEDCADGRDNDEDGAVDGADTDCQVCGNGHRDPGEACDDGNVKPGDGCNAFCQRENQAPVATCQDVSVCTDAGVCVATRPSGLATAHDADGDAVTWNSNPVGPYTPGAHSVRVTVSDGQAEASCDARVTVRDCEPPVLACPASFTVECSGQEHALVTPPAVAATDNCGPAPVQAPEGGLLPLGTHTLTYTATDAAGNRATCAPQVTVVDTQAPLLACPEDIVAECTGRESAWVRPGTPTVSDTCSPAQLTGPEADWYPLGKNPARYTARDASGNEAVCSSAIQVVDRLPPSFTLSPPEPLWPVDRRYGTVRLEDCITVHDQCSGGLAHTGAEATIGCVSSDEAQGGGEPDIVFVDATTVKVRAARDGAGDGRVYSLHFEVKDPSGNVTRGVCPLGVPLGVDTPVHDSGEQWRACREGAAAGAWKRVPTAR